MTRTIDFDLDRVRPSRDTLLWAGLLVNTEIILTVGYLVVADVTVTEWRYLAYPFVWINVGLWALVRTNPVPQSTRGRYLGAAVGAGYFLLLAYVGGLLAPGLAGHHHATSAAGHHHVTGWRIAWLPPGWGPTLVYLGSAVKLTLMPYKLVGYAALAYLVYATVIDAAGSAVSGVLGLVSCVSCTWPVLASLVAGLAGSGTAVAAAANEWSYALGTAVFVVTVGLLRWRPTIR